MYETVVPRRERMMSTLSDCKIPSKSLTLGTQVHSGTHTAVYIANMKKPSGLQQEVVVKLVKEGAPEEESLRTLKEAAILRELNHQHVLTLVGVVDTSSRVRGVCTCYQSTWCVYLLPEYVVCVLVTRVRGVCTCYQSTWCVLVTRVHGVCTCYLSTWCVLVVIFQLCKLYTHPISPVGNDSN